jgi:hypothetical protein
VGGRHLLLLLLLPGEEQQGQRLCQGLLLLPGSHGRVPLCHCAVRIVSHRSAEFVVVAWKSSLCGCSQSVLPAVVFDFLCGCAQKHRAISELVFQVISSGEIHLCSDAPGIAVRGLWKWICAITIGLSVWNE